MGRAQQIRLAVAGDRDQAEARVIAAQARDRSDSVEQRHVDVDHGRVGLDLVYELDRPQPVRCLSDDGQVGLLLDEEAERLQIGRIVVCEQHPDPAGSCFHSTIMPRKATPNPPR